MLCPDFFNVDDTEYLIPGSESSTPSKGGIGCITVADYSPPQGSCLYKDTLRDYYRLNKILMEIESYNQDILNI